MFRRVLFALLLANLSAAAAPALDRVSNTTLAMPPAPPVFGYTTVNAFPALTFGQPVCIASAPGETNRLFVLDKVGRVLVITNLAAPTLTTFMNLSTRVNMSGESGLLGIAFHPGYATNRYFYIFYSLNTNSTQGTGLHQRISRFQTSASNPNSGDITSELPYITQFDTADNHNGGCLQFGPDGYLYASLGDGGAQYDGSANSQRIDKNYFSAILRLDVDKRPGNPLPNAHPAVTTNYAIPADNPYIGLTTFNGAAVNPANIRMEFYAIGFRNPWRFSFDPVTGFLYCGDVGQDTYEEVDVVTKGGNYGWAYREGLHIGYKTGSPVGMTLIDPIQEYSHGSGATNGNSVTGGVVYRGNRISQLTGSYVFADYVSGNVWALRYNGSNTVPFQRITTRASVSAFGTDPSNGDVLLATLPGAIYRLTYNSTMTGAPLPPTLADTGAFSSPAALTENPGIVRYDLNVPFWSDHAVKTRWFSVPNTNLTITFQPTNNWLFPTGTVWIKHFDLELTNGVPSSSVRLETRLLVRNTNGVYGVTYRWGGSATNAALVPEEGLNEAFVINEGGNVRTQIWHYPARNECLTCHTPAGGLALGFNTPQLNRDITYPGGARTNQLQALSDARYFSGPLSPRHVLRAMAPADDATSSLEHRVRSYLTANCSQCHQPGGSTAAAFDTRLFTPLSAASLIDGPLNNNLGNPTNRVIVPGDPAHSVLLTRISNNGSLRMPPLASTELDDQAITLVRDWITSLTNYQNYAAWRVAQFGSGSATNSAPMEDFDGDGSLNFQEYLLQTDPSNPSDFWMISARENGSAVEIGFPQIANRGFEVETAGDLSAPVWQPLDVPSNRPSISSSNFNAVVTDVLTNQSRFYRVRTYEP